MTTAQIIAKLKGKGWDKSSYGYAISHMAPHSPMGKYWSSYSLAELKAEFFQLAETNFDKIADFSTFK